VAATRVMDSGSAEGRRAAEPQRSLPYVSIDGVLVPYADARIHVLAATVRYATAVFEGVRAYWNAVHQQLYLFRVHDHIRRLRASLAISRIPLTASDDDVAARLRALLRACAVREDVHTRIQVLVTDEHGGIGSSSPTELVLSATPMGRHWRQDGLHVTISSWRRISDAAMPPRVKSIANYHNARLALLQAVGDGYDDVILLGRHGTVAEGPGYNLCMVRRGVLVTPSVTDGVLEGITRRAPPACPRPTRPARGRAVDRSY
jgi:branched-chain amino acid aminotransferase